MYLGLLALLAFSACSSVPRKFEQPKSVRVAYSLSAADLLKYERLGDFTSRGLLTQEDCIRDLQSQVAGSGGNLVRITAIEHDYCGFPPPEENTDRVCFTARADGYRRKN